MEMEDILKKMSLEDKIALCSGANFWETKAFKQYGIPSFFMCDGPHGLRRQDVTGRVDMLGMNDSRPATCFPAAVTTASSWDTELLHAVGRAIGEEAAEQGASLVLGPGANIKRNPLCGRSFEYFSEDPLLTGRLAAAFIQGVQETGVGACIKHFACNNQERSRFVSDSVLDERTLREIYLAGFEAAVKEGQPAAVMCAYNKINGVHCSDSRELLTDILRKQWGFSGMVVTDWGGMNDRIAAFQAGCDLNMPGGSAYMEKSTLAAVQRGALSQGDIDASAGRILRLALNAQKVERGQPCSYDAHHTLAVQAAERGAVLLKNEGLLPLREGQRIAVIGHMAREPRIQGSGSSHIHPTRIVTPLEAMPGVVYAPGCDAQGGTTPGQLAQAVEAARDAEVAVIFAGLPERYEFEGFDRDSMAMPQGHLDMIEAVASVNANTVVVLLCGCAVECPWAEKVSAILYMGLGGQGVGQASVNLLYGRANPSGKLAETWPEHYGDCPSAGVFGTQKDALYQEGVYVGYRFYDTAGIHVRWPFGWGLSYTSFRYSDLRVNKDTVTAAVTNTGAVAGEEIAQMYVTPPRGGLHRPVKELKGFQKVFLRPGESKDVVFQIEERTFALWNGGWKVPGGEYTILVGPSSRELPLSAVIRKEGGAVPAPDWQAGSWYEAPSGQPSQEGWEAMLGRRYIPQTAKKGEFTMDSTVVEMKDSSFLMRALFWGTELVLSRGIGGKRDYANPEFRTMMESSAGGPLRNMQISSGIKAGVFQGLLEMANGHFLRGIRKMVKRT